MIFIPFMKESRCYAGFLAPFSSFFALEKREFMNSLSLLAPCCKRGGSRGYLPGRNPLPFFRVISSVLRAISHLGNCESPTSFSLPLPCW